MLKVERQTFKFQQGTPPSLNSSTRFGYSSRPACTNVKFLEVLDHVVETVTRVLPEMIFCGFSRTARAMLILAARIRFIARA
jgi:hypothetical protein